MLLLEVCGGGLDAGIHLQQEGLLLYLSVNREACRVYTGHRKGSRGFGYCVVRYGADGIGGGQVQRIVAHIPGEALRAGCGREDLLRADPVIRYIVSGLRVGLIARRISADQLSFGIQYLQLHVGSIGGEIIVDDGAVRRILSHGFIRRDGCIRVCGETQSPCLLRFVQDHGLPGERCAELSQGRHIIQDPEAAAMRAHHQVIILDHEIADGRGRHVEAKALPVFTIVKRYIDCALGTSIEQALAEGVLAHRVDGIIGQAVDDLFPALTAIGGLVDMRLHVVHTDAVHRCIDRVHIRMAGFHQGDLAPGGDGRWRDVGPVLSTIARDMDEAVIRAAPDGVAVNERGRHGIDHASAGHGLHFLLGIYAYGCGYLVGLPGEVRADHGPAVAAVARLEQDISGEEQGFWIDRGEEHGGCPQEAVGAGANGFGCYVLGLSGALVVFRDLTPIYDIGIQRIRGDITIFLDAHGMPFTVADEPVVAA